MHRSVANLNFLSWYWFWYSLKHPKYKEKLQEHENPLYDTLSYTNKQHSNKQFLNKQYSKLQQNLPIVSTCKLPNLEFGLKFWHQILPIYLNGDFNNFA
jgi:hypothetical protein